MAKRQLLYHLVHLQKKEESVSQQKELAITRKPSTVKKFVNIICHAWNVAKKEWGINLPAENPCDMVTLPKVNDARDRILSKSEYMLLLESCRNSHLNILEDIIVFAYSTGARQGEILRLTQSNIDYEKIRRNLKIIFDTRNVFKKTLDFFPVCT